MTKGKRGAGRKFLYLSTRHQKQQGLLGGLSLLSAVFDVWTVATSPGLLPCKVFYFASSVLHSFFLPCCGASFVLFITELSLIRADPRDQSRNLSGRTHPLPPLPPPQRIHLEHAVSGRLLPKSSTSVTLLSPGLILYLYRTSFVHQAVTEHTGARHCSRVVGFLYHSEMILLFYCLLIHHFLLFLLLIICPEEQNLRSYLIHHCIPSAQGSSWPRANAQ